MKSFLSASMIVHMVFNVLCASTLSAQEKTAENFEKEIVAIEDRIASGKSPQGSVLFVGSSSIRKWKLDESFPQLPTANHGFGGSQLADSVMNFERIVAPAKPSIIVVYAGDNDIASGKTSATVCDDFRAFVGKVEQQLPDCRTVIYLSIKPSIKRWEMREKMQDANAGIRKICETNPRLRFVDIWAPMLDADGKPRRDLFVEDGLHLNGAGYAVWTKALVPYLASPDSDR